MGLSLKIGENRNMLKKIGKQKLLDTLVLQTEIFKKCLKT